MPILILKGGKVIATHEFYQDVKDKYPECEIVFLNRKFCMPEAGQLFFDDPRTKEEKALAYKDARRLAYPSIIEQLDMIYEDKINGTTKWQDTITAIKTRFPKLSLGS